MTETRLKCTTATVRGREETSSTNLRRSFHFWWCINIRKSRRRTFNRKKPEEQMPVVVR